MSTFQTQQALKLRRSNKVPPPALDIEGTCERGGGHIQHYNPELFVDLMQSCDWTPNTVTATTVVSSSSNINNTNNNTANGADGSLNNTQTSNAGNTILSASAVPRAPRMIKKPAGCHGNAIVVGYAQMEEDYAKREREAFEDKQRMRETAFKSKLEAAKEDIARRQRERSTVRERDFEQRLAEFQARSQEIIAQSGKLVDEAEALKEKKRERLFREWTSKVFEPEQRQIEQQLASQDNHEITAKRNQLFDKFLQASNSKKNGLFRDIIIESQYDPLQDAKSSSLSYKKVPLRDDPCLTRPQREDVDPVILEVRRKAHGEDFMKTSNLFSSSKGGKSRSGVSVLQWANIGDTNYGRFSAGDNNNGAESRKNKNKPSDHLVLDHYKYPTAQGAVEELRKEGYNYRKPVANRTSNGGFNDDGKPVAGAKSGQKVLSRLDAMNSGTEAASKGALSPRSLPPIV